VTAAAATTKTVKESCSGILEDECHGQFRAMFAGVKEVKTTNSKGSAKQED
jgi:hypothetical protein